MTYHLLQSNGDARPPRLSTLLREREPLCQNDPAPGSKWDVLSRTRDYVSPINSVHYGKF
jgi:hypothetical protein